MKIEIEIDERVLRGAVTDQIDKMLRVSPYGDHSGSLYAPLLAHVREQVSAMASSIDLSEMIREKIESSLKPTIKEAIDAEIKREAKKAVKAAMAERVK